MSDTPIPSAPPSHPPDREQFWRDTFAAFAASDLSVRAFCRQRGLHEKRFYTWRKNLGLSPADRPATPAESTGHGFVPVRVVADATAEVVLPGGVTLRVPVAADPAQVGRLIAAVRGAAC
jgi:hypothetical protein